MTTLEDKLLGEKNENYCSSDEGEHDEDRDATAEAAAAAASAPLSLEKDPSHGPPLPSKWGGTSQNTGPKGVLRDWELYKEHEKLVRAEKDKELIKMVKDSSLTCRSEGEEQQAKEMMEKLQEELAETEDLEELFSDKILEQFIKARMDLMGKGQGEELEMKFGPGLYELPDGDAFLKVVDGSDPRVPVIVHIYDDKFPECSTMNQCLSNLSELYRKVQFCRVRADVVGVSGTFKSKGIPALLVYKGGSLIGNFVQLKEEFGTEFYTQDVENFLIENGMMEDRSSIPKLLSKVFKQKA